MAAADALGRLGGLDSIPALRRAAEGWDASPAVISAANLAITAIQSRHGAPHDGALALVGEGGELSEAAPARGGLAVTKEPGG